MPVTIRYEMNNREFGALMMASQTQDLADEAATLGVAVARAYAKGSGLPTPYIASIRAATGPVAVFGPQANPRRTARVYADFAYIEFGSGKGSVSGGAGRTRPQGGHSQPYRILGRTGARIGFPPRGSR